MRAMAERKVGKAGERTIVTMAGLEPAVEGERVGQRDREPSVTDGPFTEAKEVIGGYAILEAASLEHALELTERFLRVHGDEWDVECEIRAIDGPEFGEDSCAARSARAREKATEPS